MNRLSRIALVSLVVACLMLVVVPSAGAHPMGNFSINHYSGITVGNGQVKIRYIIDMAEIPTFQELGTIRPDHSTALTAQQHDVYLQKKTDELLKGISLTLDGKALAIKLEKSALSFPDGAGGLPTTRIEMNLATALNGANSGTLQYRDDNFEGRAGWREVVAAPGTGVKFEESSVGNEDITSGLTAYPTNPTSGPPNVVAASIRFAEGAGSAAGTAGGQKQNALSSTIDWAQGRADALTDLIAQKDLPLTALLVGLVVAFFLGAGHALSPGHGKTVVAAYLVGSRGTAAHAALLGVTVTLSHTIGVFLLGLVVLYAENYILPESIYPWLGFLSGLGIAIMGMGLFIQRLRAVRRATAEASVVEHTHSHDGHEHTHDHPHDHIHEHHAEHEHTHDHDHDHDHSHDAAVPHKHGIFGKPHTHLPADGQKVSIRSLLALGITGGIIPCPSALVVLLVAVASHRVALGLLLIVAFSLGLAAVLTGIGLLMVYSRGLLNRVRFNSGLLGRLPVVSAFAVACLGALIAFEALKSGGILR